MGIKIRTEEFPLWIRITSVPAGEAPIEVREAWIGVELPATTPYVEEHAFGVVTGDIAPTRETFGVPIELALFILIANGKKEAARWFHDHLPLFSIGLGCFFFGTNEAVVIDEGEVNDLEIEIDTTEFPRLVPGFSF